jgi:hypothetical protein
MMLNGILLELENLVARQTKEAHFLIETHENQLRKFIDAAKAFSGVVDDLGTTRAPEVAATVTLLNEATIESRQAKKSSIGAIKSKATTATTISTVTAAPITTQSFAAKTTVKLREGITKPKLNPNNSSGISAPQNLVAVEPVGLMDSVSIKRKNALLRTSSFVKTLRPMKLVLYRITENFMIYYLQWVI